MANTIMPKYREALMKGESLDLVNEDLRFVAVDADQHPADDEDEFLSDILVGAQVSISDLLTNKTVHPPTFSGGVVQLPARITCDPVNLPDIGGPNTPEYVYLFHDTGSPSTSRLLVRWDTGVSGLPLTQDGVDDLIQQATANGLFGL